MQALSRNGQYCCCAEREFFLLWETDHFVIEKLKPHGYVRYMDDILLFSNSKAELNSFYQKLKLFVEENIRVEFKTPVINSCKNGVPFLGFLIKPSDLLANIPEVNSIIPYTNLSIHKESAAFYVFHQSLYNRI